MNSSRTFAFLLASVLVFASLASGSDGPVGRFGFSAERMTKDIKYLASDELGGRAPGSRGERLAVNYLARAYEAMGLSPGNPDGSYFQEVPLIGARLTNEPVLELRGANASIELRYGKDFMGWTLRKQETVEVRNAGLVFVGYGIEAPEYGWNDYKGVDLKGKIIVMLVGDPPLPDSTMFGGKAMTYYGRWTYKYEAAAAKGALGAVIIHNTKAAGYPWSVVANSWSGEQFDIVRADKGASRCALEGWITEEAAEKIFELSGLTLESATRMSLDKGFEPVPLALSGSIRLSNEFRSVKSSNVAALLPGSDPAHRDEVIIYTAHWDHLGRGKPVRGDSIYNGALDNASGVAGVLEIARTFAAHRDELKRSILFLNTTAEESGLLGSYTYCSRPLFPLEKTVAVINLDGINIWGKTRDMIVVGKGYTSLDDYLQRALKAQGRRMRPDMEPEKGFYFRSDHFPFVKKGVPALYAGTGMDFVGKPSDWGMGMRKEYTMEKYHKPQDEYSPSWNLEGALQDLQALFEVGYALAVSDDFPTWREGSAFKRIRARSMR